MGMEARAATGTAAPSPTLLFGIIDSRCAFFAKSDSSSRSIVTKRGLSLDLLFIVMATATCMAEYEMCVV